MKPYFFLIFLCSSLAFSQKDSLQIGDKYLEDQLYLGISFNQLFSQPELINGSGFSYGLTSGYIKDIPLNKQGSFSLGIGIGYAYDSYNHGFELKSVQDEVVFTVPNVLSSNSLKTHSIEMPFEIRWRTSTANQYKFWRVYSGIKFNYNIKNTFLYESNGVVSTYENVARYDKFNYGLTLSAGYADFNFNLYVGLKPLLKNASQGEADINTKVIKMGLIFYIL